MDLIQKNKMREDVETDEIANPLVSIIVLTYNSSKYVNETLDSAKAQSYQNIELIVCDDCSSDNTIEICITWIEENKDRFVRCNIVTVLKNTGVSANCNRGIYNSEGVWIKFIAGDDILLPDCISENIKFIKEYPEVEFLFSNVKEFSQAENRITNYIKFPSTKFFEYSANKQKRKLITFNYVLAPTTFVKKETILRLNGFDERIRNLEDYPLWIKITENGIKLYHFNSDTVIYRIHSNSINSGSSNKTWYREDKLKFFYYYLLPNTRFHNLPYIIHYFLYVISIQSPYCKFLVLLSPLHVFRLIRGFFQNSKL